MPGDAYSQLFAEMLGVIRRQQEQGSSASELSDRLYELLQPTEEAEGEFIDEVWALWSDLDVATAYEDDDDEAGEDAAALIRQLAALLERGPGAA